MANLIPLQIISQAPKTNLIVFATNDNLHVYDTSHHKFVKSKDLDDKKHTSTIRSIQFSSDEHHLVTCGDDKMVKVWNCSNWTLVSERKGTKKLSNSIFASFPSSKQESKTNSENAIVFSDKFGDVFVFLFGESTSTPTLLLGHCSIVTSMILSPNKKFLITSDKDEKIRVSLFPNTYEIHSFCLGHTSIVTKLCIPSSHPHLLVSGGGDLTIRLWNYADGNLINTYKFNELKDSKSLVAGIVHSSVSNFIAVLFEGNSIIYLFSISKDEKSLKLEKKIEVDKSSNPLNLIFDDKGNLYVVGAKILIQYFKFDITTKNYIPTNETIDFVKEVSKEVTDQKAYKDMIDNISLRQLRKKSDENPDQSKKRKVEDEE